MQDFQFSNKFIINKSDLSHQKIIKYLDDIKNNSVDYADIYFQYSKNEFWSLEDGVVKNGSYSIDQGVGVRSISGEKTNIRKRIFKNNPGGGLFFWQKVF